MTRERWLVLRLLAASIIAVPVCLGAQDPKREEALEKTRAQMAELEARVASGEATLMDCGMLGMQRAIILQLETAEGATREQRRAARQRALAEWRDREPPDACAHFLWAQSLSVNEGLDYLAAQARRFGDDPLFLEARVTALWNAGRMREAEDLIDEYLARNPLNVRAIKLRVAHASQMGDELTQQNSAEELFANDPSDVRAAEQWFTARAQGLGPSALHELGRQLLERHAFSARSQSLCRKLTRVDSEGAHEIALACFDRVLDLDLGTAERENALVGRAQLVILTEPESVHELTAELSADGRRQVASYALWPLLRERRCQDAARLFEERIVHDMGGRDVAGFAASCAWNPRERALAASLVQRLEGEALVSALNSWPDQADPSPLLELLPDAVGREPDSSNLRRAIHKFLVEHGTVEQQVRHFDDWARVNPFDAWIRKDFVRDLYWQGEVEIATRLAQQYFDRLSASSDQSSTDYSAGMMAVEMGMVEQAATFLERFRSRGGRQRDLVRLASRVALLQEDLPRATELLRQSMFLDQGSGHSAAWYGEILSLLGQSDRLARDLEAVYDELSETPGERPQGSRAGWVAARLQGAGYYGEAAAYLESIDPDQLTAIQRQELVRLQRDSGNIEGAIVAAREAVTRAPGNVTRHGDLIRLLMSDERFPEAIEAIDLAQSMHPDNPRARFRYQLGEALLETGRSERAVAILTELARESNSRRVDRLLDRALIATGTERNSPDEGVPSVIRNAASVPLDEGSFAATVTRADRMMAGSDGAIDFAGAVEILRAAAEAGDPLARLRMLTLDAFGTHVLADELRTRYAAIDPESVRTLTVDSPTAQSVLGTAYLAGVGPFDEDPTQAREYFRMAATNAPWAGHNLAWMHETGLGGPVDLPRARELYAQAAALGNASSDYALARLHLELDSDVDLRRVEELLESASNRNHATAAYSLGRLLLTGEHGMVVDTARGLDYVEKAAAQGLDDARQMLVAAYSEFLDRAVATANIYAAQTFTNGMADTHRTVRMKVAEYLDQVAVGGNVEAQVLQTYATANASATIVSDTSARVVESLQRAAERGSKLAMYFLAEHLVGSMSSQTEAIDWWDRAAGMGHRESQHELGWRYVRGVAVTKDVSRGFQLLEAAANDRYLRAVLFLARCYDRGDCGVPVNETRALHWYRQAADQGEESDIGWLRARK